MEVECGEEGAACENSGQDDGVVAGWVLDEIALKGFGGLTSRMILWRGDLRGGR